MMFCKFIAQNYTINMISDSDVPFMYSTCKKFPVYATKNATFVSTETEYIDSKFFFSTESEN